MNEKTALYLLAITIVLVTLIILYTRYEFKQVGNKMAKLSEQVTDNVSYDELPDLLPRSDVAQHLLQHSHNQDERLKSLHTEINQLKQQLHQQQARQRRTTGMQDQQQHQNVGPMVTPIVTDEVDEPIQTIVKSTHKPSRIASAPLVQQSTAMVPQPTNQQSKAAQPSTIQQSTMVPSTIFQSTAPSMRFQPSLVQSSVQVQAVRVLTSSSSSEIPSFELPMKPKSSTLKIEVDDEQSIGFDSNDDEQREKQILGVSSEVSESLSPSPPKFPHKFRFGDDVDASAR